MCMLKYYIHIRNWKIDGIQKQGLSRALDPCANDAWLSKLTELKVEVFFLGGQRNDQKRKKGCLIG